MFQLLLFLSLSSFISLVCCPGQFLSNLSTQICPLLITWLCELITKSLLNKKDYKVLILLLWNVLSWVVFYCIVYCSYIEYNTIHSIPYNMSCIVLYGSYWVVLYCILLFILGCIVLYFIVHIGLYCIVLYCIIQYNAMFIRWGGNFIFLRWWASLHTLVFEWGKMN
jgi:hypothetical protein